MKAIELSPQGEAPTRPRQFAEKPSFEEQKQNKPAQSHFWARGIIGISLVATFLPLAYLISVSLMGRDETVSGILWTLDPQLSNWGDVLFSSDIPRSIGNSLIAATFGALLSLAGGLLGAWAIVHYKTGGRALSALVTSPWLLPPVVAVIPLFMLLRVLNLNDSLVGLTLIYALINLPIAVWLLEGFLHKIPPSIFDAAAVDGAGPWRTLVSIVTPLMLPALIAIGTIIAILNYNEFLLATFLTQSVESQTAPVALSLFYGDRTPHFGKIAAASVIVVIPVFAAATFLQRWMIDGLVNGVGK